MNVASLISLFGNQKRLGLAADAASQSTVASWVVSGSVPLSRRVAIIRNADKFGVDRVEAFRLLASEMIEAAGVKV